MRTDKDNLSFLTYKLKFDQNRYIVYVSSVVPKAIGGFSVANISNKPTLSFHKIVLYLSTQKFIHPVSISNQQTKIAFKKEK